MNRRIVMVFIILLALLAANLFFALLLGRSGMPSGAVLETVLAGPWQEGTAAVIIWRIRVPRIIFGFVVGAGLALCGCVFQGLLRNPLAEPYTLGVAGGAVFGATLVTVTGLSGSITLPLAAFAGALVAIFGVYSLSVRKGFSVAMLILAGVILNFLFSAVVLFIFSVATSEEIHSVMLWLMGDLSVISGPLLTAIIVFVAIGTVAIFLLHRELDILTLGDEKASQLGIDAVRAKRLLFVAASLVAGACVGTAGMIGFVGLIIPHLMRRLVGPGHRLLLPASLLAGGLFLSFADALARVAVPQSELPVGVITGMVGGIFFLVYLMRVRDWRAL